MRSVLLIWIALVAGCSSLNPVAVSSSEVYGSGPLVFNESAYSLKDRVISTLDSMGWVLVYDHFTRPTKKLSGLSNSKPFSKADWDAVAWDKTYTNAPYPNRYIQARTPIGLTTFGASVFIVISKQHGGKSSMVVTMSSGQALEKSKLEGKIKLFVEELGNNG